MHFRSERLVCKRRPSNNCPRGRRSDVAPTRQVIDTRAVAGEGGAMTTYDDLAQRYIDTWNETDPSARRAAVDQLYTEDARYVDPMAAAEGREAIASMIGAVQEQFPTSGSGWPALSTGTTTRPGSAGNWVLRDHRHRSWDSTLRSATRQAASRPCWGSSTGCPQRPERSGLPGRPTLHLDGDDGSVKRNSLVLNVFLA